MITDAQPFVAIACGGTGGHLFPGLAVGEELVRRGCAAMLLVSPKEVDQQAVQSLLGLEVATLPSVASGRGHFVGFLAGFWKSFRVAQQLFRQRPPQAVLAMGGFTSAPPVLAGKACGAVTFLHESNTIPGKANRWLAHVVDQAFVGFPAAAGKLHHANVVVTGTPVRPQFQPADPAASRLALGLDASRPVLLVMGGSQGASGLNELVTLALPQLTQAAPDLQYVHLTGVTDVEKVRATYAAQRCSAVVRPFLTEMELALAAATLAVSRAGASSLAELAAMRLPAILVPYPFAADNHQFYNARAFSDVGAALLLEQKTSTPQTMGQAILKLLRDERKRAALSQELVRWHAPQAAEHIAEKMLALMQVTSRGPGTVGGAPDQPPRSGARDRLDRRTGILPV
jgi:UDP-N-acetylglucosamine--N-acetylmuramyl-(pentapeptide) pyrophosphoryl-undecaprenol N-acetylglucosamine transferase